MKDCGTERLEPATGDHSSEGRGGTGQGSEGPERGLGPGQREARADKEITEIKSWLPC